jgi:FAD synthase
MPQLLGSYVPISMGQMRNVWFPMKTAAYVTDVQLKDLKAKNISAVRDFQFGVSDPVAVKAANTLSQRLPTRTVEVEKLPVSQTPYA